MVQVLRRRHNKTDVAGLIIMLGRMVPPQSALRIRSPNQQDPNGDDERQERDEERAAG